MPRTVRIIIRKLIVSIPIYFYALLPLSIILAVHHGAYDYVQVKLVIAQLLIVLIFFIWFFNYFVRRQVLYKKNPLILPLLAFFFWALFSCFLSPYWCAGEEALSRLATYLILFFLFIQVGFVPIVIYSWFAGMFIASLYGLFQYYFQGIGWPDSTFGNPNIFAAALIVTLPFTVAFLAVEFKRFLKCKKVEENTGNKPVLPALRCIGMSLITLLLFFTLILTKSRGALLGIGLAVLCWGMFFVFRYGNRRKKLFFAFFCLVFLLILIMLECVFWEEINFHIGKSIASGTSGIRLDIWRGTFRMIASRPLTGWGIGAFSIIYPRFRPAEYFLNPYAVYRTEHAHSEYLELTAETGITGLVLYLWFWFAFFRRATRMVTDADSMRDRFILYGLLIGISALLFQNLVSISLRVPSTSLFLWLAAGLVISFSPHLNPLPSGERKPEKFLLAKREGKTQ